MSDILLVPEGWIVTKFTDVLDIQGGTQPPKSNFVDQVKEGYIRLLQIRDFGDKPVPTFIPITSKLKLCDKDDVLIGRYGASLGRICTGMKGAYNVALAKVLFGKYLDRRFLKAYLESELFQASLRLLSRSAQNGFNKDDLNSFVFLLPPFNEQKIIAEKLNLLLAQVQETKSRLEQIPELLKQFRQSVLSDAVSGKLTEDWRKNDKCWISAILGNLILDSTNGLSKRKGTNGKEITVLRLADFKNACRVFGNERKIVLTDKEIEKFTLKNGDILVIRVNGSVDLAGRFIEYSLQKKIEGFCDHFIRLRLNEKKILSKYLLFVANNGEGRLYLQNSLSTSAGQNTINQASIRALNIPLPSLEEQIEIVRRVEQLFAYADKIEQQVNTALEKVNHLPQSILAKAFRGELTAQWRAENVDLITGENSAASLLEKIQVERAQNNKNKKKK
ncbi:type I restriction endonuclease subunit S [Gilliamella sp. ESL0441]|uniref:restriction endonuclease subunit S n=1 Tax=Gilliamella sp. ESL0441 TaxID=2704654 RepID=UPI001C69A38B|nr:restriction endonuclease subunit S [Gilliamella sp. ESL0441]QYN45429.1 type I restriction endonuclease subunit S [Gilliamella sp. ESL0441]